MRLFSFLAATVLLAQPYDLLIRNGRIVDGTGNPSFIGDVAISGRRIAAIGKLGAAQAKRTIEMQVKVGLGNFTNESIATIRSIIHWSQHRTIDLDRQWRDFIECTTFI